MGLQGPPGRDATPASTYRPLAAVGCEALLDLIGNGGVFGADGITETLIAYSWLQYSNRDVDVACEAAIGSALAGADGNYYPSVTKGAQSALCVASVNYPATPDDIIAGHWRFETRAGGPVAEYVDAPSHPLNGKRLTFEENDCGVYIADQSGTWLDAALSDIF